MKKEEEWMRGGWEEQEIKGPLKNRNICIVCETANVTAANLENVLIYFKIKFLAIFFLHVY